MSKLINNKCNRITYQSNKIYINTQFNIKQKYGFHKPFGLWYSCDDLWIEWLKDSGMDDMLIKYKYKYGIKIDKKKILTIKNDKDMQKFIKEYKPINDNNPIDWNRISKKYSGIEIIPYLEDFSIIGKNMQNWYLYWDIPSGCIWNSDAIISIKELEFNL